SVTDRAHGRLLGEAALHAPVTALIEGAARRQALQIGWLPRDGAQLLGARLVEAGRGAQESVRVRMLRVVEDVAHWRFLDHASAIHDQHAVAEPGHHAERM